MIYSESINLRIKNQEGSTLKSKIVSAVFMFIGLASGVVAVITLLHKTNVL